MTFPIYTVKLLRQEIRQNGWMFGLTTLLHFLLGPVYFLITTSDYAALNTATSQRRFEGFFTSQHFLAQLLLMIVCISISIFIYRYLFNKRMVDLYHGVPIRRTQLFLMKYLHGFLLWIVPFLFCNICITVLCVLRLLDQPYLLPVLAAQFQSSLLLLLCFFVLYHLFLVAVYISGNVLNMFANTAIIGCSIVGLLYICYGFASRYWDTYCTEISETLLDILCSLSPFLAPFRVYVIWQNDAPLSEHLLFIVLLLAVTIILLLLAWMLCLKRHSEMAERGTCLRAYLLPAHLIAAIFCGLAGGYFFSEIVASDLRLFWGIFGTILTTVVAFGAINSIFGANIKSFFKSKGQILFATVFNLFVLLSFQLDWFGYDTYLPEKEEIAGMALYHHSLSDDSAYLILDEDGELIYYGTSNRVTQEKLFTDTDICYDLLNSFINNSGGDGNYYYVKVALKNGKTYLRQYFLPHYYADKLAPLVETEAFMNTNYKFRAGLLGYPATMELQLFGNTIKSEVPTDSMKKILDAYWLDFKEHYSLQELSSYRAIGFITGDYRYDGNNSQRFFDIPILSTYSRTIAVLEELYPIYLPAVTGYEDIRRINLYVNTYDHQGMSSMYSYFGYESADTNTTASDTTDNEASIAIAESIGYTNIEYELEDAEIIEKLYPYLYFGDYRDFFDKNEYIYLGQIITEKNFTIDAYVESAELPKEMIDLLFEKFFEEQ